MKIRIPFFYLYGLFVNSHQHLIKFGMLERPPHFMAKNVTDSTKDDQPYHGSWVKSIEWLSQRQHFEYEIIPMNNNVAGNFQMRNGTAIWTGASGRLLRGEFDVLGPQILTSFGRSRFFDFAGVADEEGSALITPPLTEESPIKSTITPFQPIVWLMILISLMSVAIYFSVSSAFNYGTTELNVVDRLKKSLRIGDYVLSAVAILTNQGPMFKESYEQQSRLSFRLTAGVWCLFAFVMVNVYCSTLTAHMTNRKMSIPPFSALEVMEQGVLSYIALDDGFGREFILSATSGPLKKLGDTFRRHPENFVPDQETGFLKVTSGCCAYSDVVNYLKFRMSKDYRQTGKCRVFIGKTVRGYGFAGLLLKKGNAYKNLINRGVLELYQTGLVGFWREKFSFGEISPCDPPKKIKSKKLRRLNLKDLASAFFLLGLGVSASLLLFLVEQFQRCNDIVKTLRPKSTVIC